MNHSHLRGWQVDGGEQRPPWQGQPCCAVLLGGTARVAVAANAGFLAAPRCLVKLKKLCIFAPVYVLFLVSRQCELPLLRDWE